ncbi:SIMPL domain-containing protein [Natrialba taiwanensis]|uniref:SIMPL domain-containing protein n=1 Tax=Natrialba taiwanensis DSM 12281 TaxID=1230458 RepID=L9ZQM7_9EURY|nr:SIMPL domain-containing protein [Natrialba taiwanensis]ELY88815.1 hypothetical protein C484_14508 [Natrialba taiwanensis DSM 12281]
MDRRQFLAVSSVGVVAAMAGCVGSALSTDDPAQSGDETGSSATDNEITVSAEGEVEAEPDTATVSLGVEATDESAEAVSDELATQSEQLRDAIDDLGIPDENVEEGRYRISPSAAARREEGVDEFAGTHSYQVTIDDVNRVGEIIDAAVSAGADDIGRVNFTLQEETRAALRKDAIDDALATTDEEAAHIASNREVELAGTKSVTTNDVRVNSVRHDVEFAASADDASAPPTEIDADPVTVTASATVVYAFQN